MSYKFIFFSILGVCLLPTTAQTQNEPSKPTYTHKVYLNDGNTYIQRSMPMYIKFSVTPDGENHPLKSKQHPEDANPMYLDAEGIHYIRHQWAVNPQTKQMVNPQRETVMEVYADGLAPITSHRFDGAPRYSNGQTVFFGKGLRFSLTARDAVSGVMETQYALGGGYQKYGQDVAVNNEGAAVLYYYSADNVGNAEETKSSKFTVDLTAPSSNHEIVGIVYNNSILSPSTRFKLSSSDNLAGVRITQYGFDSGSPRAYNGQISMSGLGDGQHTLYYYSTDHVKNEESRKSFQFYLDLIPPVANIAIEGDQHKGQYTYVSARTKFNLSATDNHAGVKNIFYRVNEGELNTFSSAFNLPNSLGYYSIKYDANDNVDNLSANKYLNVYLDNQEPVTGINYGNPQFFHRDTLFINKNTPVTLFSKDGHSGVKQTQYAVDGAGMQNYSKFIIAGEGHHTVTFKSTDNVNNEEQVKTSKVFVDNTAPEIFVNFSIEPIGTKSGLPIYPEYVRMYIGATDKHVGTERILYSIDGGALTDYSSPQTLDISEVSKLRKNKKYKVRVVAKDKLGNEGEKTVEFFVGRGE